MRFVGNQYIDDCVLVGNEAYAITEEFSAVNRGDKIHVSIQTAITGYGFVAPKVRRNGTLQSFSASEVDALLKGRYSIYFSLDDIFAVVVINGDYIKSNNCWSEDTRVELYTPDTLLSGLDLTNPTKGVLSFIREHSLELTSCTGLCIGSSRLSFTAPVQLRYAILEALPLSSVYSKSAFYIRRTQ